MLDVVKSDQNSPLNFLEDGVMRFFISVFFCRTTSSGPKNMPRNDCLFFFEYPRGYLYTHLSPRSIHNKGVDLTSLSLEILKFKSQVMR
jgi:hypothetical protein